MSVPVSMTFMSFDMDQPLNKAHGYERVAEGFMKEEKWEEAEQNYILAAEMMKKALMDVSSTKIALPIKMQAEKFEKMKDVINIKRKEANSSKNSRPDSQQSQKSISNHKTDYSVPNASMSRNKNDETPQIEEKTVDKGTETSKISEKKQKISPPNTWQFVPRDIVQLIQERETDSLLQFLNFPMNPENDNEDLLASSKKPKNQEALIEEYRTRFQALQTTAIALLQALEDTENENKSLKSEVFELRSEVSNLSERLMVYEDNGNYSPLGFTEEDMSEPQRNFTPPKFTSDPMAASMLIEQPENYFKFEGNDIASEIRQATEEEFIQRKDFKSLPAYQTKSKKKVLFDQWGPVLGSMDQSVRYEDLDEEVNAEVSETILSSASDMSPNFGVASPLHYASIAGLPPLSPVHFELDEKDNIITDHKNNH